MIPYYKYQAYEPKEGWLDVRTWREQKCPKVTEYTQAEKAALKKAQENATQAIDNRDRQTKHQRTQSGTYSNSAASTSEGTDVPYSPASPIRHPQSLPTLTSYGSYQEPSEAVPLPPSSSLRPLPPYIPYQGLLEAIPGAPSNSPPNVPVQPNQQWPLEASNGAHSIPPRALPPRLSQQGSLEPVPRSVSNPQQTAPAHLPQQVPPDFHLRALFNSPSLPEFELDPV